MRESEIEKVRESESERERMRAREIFLVLSYILRTDNVDTYMINSTLLSMNKNKIKCIQLNS